MNLIQAEVSLLLKSRQLIIGLAISALFLWWALSNTNLEAVWDAILAANYWSLIPALALYFTGVGVRALRWGALLKPIIPQTATRKTFEVVVIGYMANNVLPARIGELVRAYVISKRHGVRKTTTLATIFVERIFDGLTMIGFAAAVILFVLVADRGALNTGEDAKLGTLLTGLDVPIILGAVAFLGALALFVGVASSRSRVERLVTFGLRFVPGRLRSRVERLAGAFIDGLGSLTSASSLAAVFLLSILAWLLETGMYYVIGTWGFDLRGMDGELLPFYAYMLATSFINLSTLLPQAPGYLGVFTAVGKVVLAGAFGVGQESATSYMLLLQAALLIPVTLLGFFYLGKEQLSWRDLTGLEKTRAQAAQQAHELEGPLTDIELMREGRMTAGEAEAELERAGEQPPKPRRQADQRPPGSGPIEPPENAGGPTPDPKPRPIRPEA